MCAVPSFMSMAHCDVLSLTVIMTSCYAAVSLRLAVITEFVTILCSGGGRPFPGNCYLLSSFCL